VITATLSEVGPGPTSLNIYMPIVIKN
jgi:hypothetical protein